MKILCVGNSFSEDATRYLEAMAGGRLKVRNAYIGGCSLERHCSNIASSEKNYLYKESTAAIAELSLEEALRADSWDVITVQQVSSLSGVISSYEPFLGRLLTYLREECPRADIVFHETWAYESNAAHPDFPTYHCDRLEMEAAIEAAVPAATAPYGLPVLRTGQVIKALRRTEAFAVEAGGLPITRDGYHLSYLYGRYAAGLSWLRFFTGADAEGVSYCPELADPGLLPLIRKTVNESIIPWEGSKNGTL